MDFAKMATLCATLKTALVTALPASHTNTLREIISKMSPGEFLELAHAYSVQSQGVLKAVLQAQFENEANSQAVQAGVASFVPRAEQHTALLEFYFAVSQLCEAERLYRSLADEPDLLNPTLFYVDRIQAASRVCQDAQPPGSIEWPFDGEAPFRLSPEMSGVYH
ncbi:hypothetical protein [Pseudoalteromonas 'SMAR']|uniref:hypothetical protein n=1 Tax=Pseudoalteromonas 'SMAR' TaxID=3416908 RepID=UPI003AF2E2A3